MDEAPTSLSFRVTGRVQGVYFRAWTREEAVGRGLSGWVRNTADGAVEGVVQGPAAQLRAFAARLKVGPPAARVASVETAPQPHAPLEGFTIRR